MYEPLIYISQKQSLQSITNVSAYIIFYTKCSLLHFSSFQTFSLFLSHFHFSKTSQASKHVLFFFWFTSRRNTQQSMQTMSTYKEWKWKWENGHKHTPLTQTHTHIHTPLYTDAQIHTHTTDTDIYTNTTNTVTHIYTNTTHSNTYIQTPLTHIHTSLTHTCTYHTHIPHRHRWMHTDTDGCTYSHIRWQNNSNSEATMITNLSKTQESEYFLNDSW